MQWVGVAVVERRQTVVAVSSVRLPRGLGTRPTDLSSTLLFARCDGAQAIADQLTSERALFDDERERLLGEWTTLYNKMDSEKAALEKEISALRLKNNEMRVRCLGWDRCSHWCCR